MAYLPSFIFSWLLSVLGLLMQIGPPVPPGRSVLHTPPLGDGHTFTKAVPPQPPLLLLDAWAFWLCHGRHHESLCSEQRSPSGLLSLHLVREETGTFFRIALIISTLMAAHACRKQQVLEGVSGTVCFSSEHSEAYHPQCHLSGVDSMLDKWEKPRKKHGVKATRAR